MYLDPNTYKQGDLVLTGTPTSTTYVVTVGDVKDHLRIDSDDENSLIADYIKAATQLAENFCGRHFLEHEYKLYFTEIVKEASLIFPDCTLMTNGSNHPVFWKNPSWSVALHSDEAYLDGLSNPSIVKLTSDFTDNGFPPTEEGGLFWFHFKTGFGELSADVPEAIKQAIKLIVADMYYFREDRKRTFPMASEILLQPYKCYH